MKQFDVLVVGGGHAGVEAAAAAARRGASVCLLTQNVATIGVMSCNPSIGGVGKGHLVREIDALDGLMARAADAAAIHHRMLNRSKGAAVHGPRVQADRRRYKLAVSNALASYDTIRIVAGEAVDLDMHGSRCAGVRLSCGNLISAVTTVLATGTFLGARIFRGNDRETGGRIGERPATALAEHLRALELPLCRLKTGTPPRLDGRTIDWARLAPQPSDRDSWTMSTMPVTSPLPQLACAITRTTERTHEIIRQGLNTSPLFSGDIQGRGPRYCPSIEDKVLRFGDRDEHQVFLEPEGLDNPLVYPNGISTSLAPDVQQRLVHSISGLERATIAVPGYAVEYDHVDPRLLNHRLAVRSIDGLFCAGQINGTTGYEEAAAQGLVAGANAAAAAMDKNAVQLDRGSSYTGVMIDDLVLQGVSEPYRMLTARAEYRLSLRADNAEVRMSQTGAAAGLLSTSRHRHVMTREEMRDKARSGRSDGVPSDIVAEIEEDRRYAPYLLRQQEEIARMRADQCIRVPPMHELGNVQGLSNEMLERLRLAAPATLGEASRVQGVTPAALTALWLHTRRVAA